MLIRSLDPFFLQFEFDSGRTAELQRFASASCAATIYSFHHLERRHLYNFVNVVVTSPRISASVAPATIEASKAQCIAVCESRTKTARAAAGANAPSLGSDCEE